MKRFDNFENKLESILRKNWKIHKKELIDFKEKVEDFFLKRTW